MKTMHVPATLPAGSGRIAARLGLGALLVAVLTANALSQEVERRPFDLVGTVTDEAGQPLVGAFVSPADSDWGSLTGENGRFVLRKTTPGAVALRVELIGYETLVWSGEVEEGEALTLRLVAEPIVLEGLNVVADRFESRRRGVATSVRWYDHDDLATSTLPTALDFVAMRAGLARVRCNGRWTDQCVLVRGRAAEPVVYVDEFPVVGGMEYLETLQPHELYMVEVYGGGRHIRAYTPQFMEQAAESRLRPIPLVW